MPQIFQWCIDGVSLAGIARTLTELGVPPVGIASEGKEHGKSGKWWAKSVGAIIRCPTYMGTRREGNGRTGYGRVIHECEALVPADVFRRAGEALAGRPKTLRGVRWWPRTGRCWRAC